MSKLISGILIFNLVVMALAVLAFTTLFLVLVIRAKLRGPLEFRTPEFAVELVDGRDGWVKYKEGERVLWLRADVSRSGANTEVSVWLENKVYLPPDYSNPLPESRIAEIQQRISRGLKELNISSGFVRQGWISFG